MSSQKNKQRILRILKYLYGNTDEQHPITNTALVEMFTDDTVSGTRKTIRNDIDVLLSEGFDIIETKRHRDKCYYPRRLLDLSDVSILFNAVGSCRFISEEKKTALKEKLLKLVSVHESGTMVQYMYVTGEIRQDKTQLYREIDLISEAINKNRKIKYKCYEYLPAMEKSFKNNGESYCLSPSAIIWSGGCYYALGHSDIGPIQSVAMLRIDQICNMEISDEPANIPDGFDLKEYINELKKVHKKETVDIVLECAGGQLQNVIDYFGDTIEPHPAKEGNFFCDSTCNR